MSFPNLSALAVRERAVTLFFLILAVFAGLYAFVSLGRAEDPAFTVRVMMVSVGWPGATPQELQRQVVDRLEKRIQEVENLYRIETTVRPGQASLQVEFHDYTPQSKVPDLFYEVRKRMLDEARSLPAGVIGPIVNDDFSDVYFKLIAVTAPGMPMRELTREAEQMRDRLRRIDGVHKALLLGERSERVFLEFDSARLMSLGIAPQAVFDAIDASNRLLPAVRATRDRVPVAATSAAAAMAVTAAARVRVASSAATVPTSSRAVRAWATAPSAPSARRSSMPRPRCASSPRKPMARC